MPIEDLTAHDLTPKDFTSQETWTLLELHRELKKQTAARKTWVAKGKQLYNLAFRSPLETFKILSNFNFNNTVVERLKKVTPAPEMFENLEKQNSPINKAARLIKSATYLQLLFEQSITVPEGAFYVAAIYPLSDNYLDDKNIAEEDKLKMLSYLDNIIKGQNNIFHKDPPKIVERILSIATRFMSENSGNTKLVNVLLEVNQCQRDSLMQSRYYDHVWDIKALLSISMKKGASSYELMGRTIFKDTISDDRIIFLRGLGAIHQLMDDFEDIVEDCNEGNMTFFIYSSFPDRHKPFYNVPRFIEVVSKFYQMTDAFFTRYENRPDIVNPGLLDQIRLDYTEILLGRINRLIDYLDKDFTFEKSLIRGRSEM